MKERLPYGYSYWTTEYLDEKGIRFAGDHVLALTANHARAILSKEGKTHHKVTGKLIKEIEISEQEVKDIVEKRMAVLKKIKGKFYDENGDEWKFVDGNPVKVYNQKEEEFEVDFLGDKFKDGDKKVESGEISCNLDNPEDCINCGS